MRHDGAFQDAGSGVIVKLAATHEELSRLPGLKRSVAKYGQLQTSYVLITCHHIIPAASAADLKGLHLDLGLGEEHTHRLELLVCAAVSCCGKDGIISSGPDPQHVHERIFLPHQNSTSDNPCYFTLDFTMLFLNKKFQTILSKHKIAVPELSLNIPEPWLKKREPNSVPGKKLHN